MKKIFLFLAVILLNAVTTVAHAEKYMECWLRSNVDETIRWYKQGENSFELYFCNIDHSCYGSTTKLVQLSSEQPNEEFIRYVGDGGNYIVDLGKTKDPILGKQLLINGNVSGYGCWD